MNGVDVTVITEDIRGLSAVTLALFCQELESVGLRPKEVARPQGLPDGDIATVVSPLRILVLAANEDEELLKVVLKVQNVSGRPIPETRSL